MKKKLFVFVFAVIAAFAVSALALGCGDDDKDKVVPKKPVSVTVEFDAERGSAVVENASGVATETFASGSTAVVKTTAADGYALVALKINGEKVKHENGVYRFNVEKDTAVEAVFGMEEMPQAAIDASKTTVSISGTCSHSENGSPAVVNGIKTVFGTDTIYIEEKSTSGVVVYADVYANVGGKLAQVRHTIDNTVENNVSDDDFADYYNPFALLAPDDFETTDKADVFKISDAAKARAAAMAITGWNEKIGLFEATVAGGKITEVHIETADGAVSGGVEYYSDYRFALTGHGNTELDESLTKPYAHGDEHDVLRDALMEMAQSKNYTVSVTDVMSGEDDVIFDIYVTETAIYDDCPGFYNGWVYSEGSVYPFDRHVGAEPEITLYDALNNVSSVTALRAAFIGYAPELFALTDKDENGRVYTLRCNELAGDIFPEFGDGTDRMKYFSFAIDGQILLDENDKLLGVLFDYSMYGYVGSITMTYKDVNSTELPQDLDLTKFVKVSVFDPFEGTYTNAEHEVVISAEEGIVIDGVRAQVKSYDKEYGVFTVDLEGVELYVGKKTTAQLIVYNENYTICYELLLQNIAPVDIPAKMTGKWNGMFYDETAVKSTDVAYDAETDTLSFKLDGKACTISGGGAQKLDTVQLVGLTEDPIVFERGESTDGSNCKIIPLKYTGSYALTVTVSGVKVQNLLFIYEDEIEYSQTDPSPAQAIVTEKRVILDGVELDVLSYSDEEGLTCYNVDNGLTYNFFYIKSDKTGKEEIDVLMFDGATRLYDAYFFTEKDDSFVAVPELFLGTWSGFDSYTNADYTIVATVDGVEITRSAGGQQKTFDGVVKKVETVTAHGNELLQMTIEANGVLYTVTQSSEAKRVMLAAADDSFSVSLEKQNVVQPSGDIPEKFYGDFMSADGEAMILIDETGITFLMLGGTEVDFVFVSYDSTESYILITVDGESYTIQDISYADPVTKIMIANEDYTVMVTLDRYEEQA